jgi:hypothetical protein
MKLYQICSATALKSNYGKTFINYFKCFLIALYFLFIIYSPDDTITTTFDVTPVMSSYLNAFVVSDFAYRSLYNGPGKTEHRVYAREEDVENVALSLYNSDVFLRQLEHYCNYVYELPKMWSAAIPDFGESNNFNKRNEFELDIFFVFS